nr:hypothetical protein [Tanacetum cinerariifolium]
MDRIQNLRFTLRYKNKEYVLDEQIPKINDNSIQDETEAHPKHYDDANKVSCIMTAFMSPELQKTFEFTWAYEMNLKEMFQAKASKECHDIDVPSTLATLVLTVGHNAKKRYTSHSNWKGKVIGGKSHRGSKRKAEYDITPTSDPKEAVCFYCNEKGHWKRSCPKFLKDLKDGKVEKGSHSGSKGKHVNKKRIAQLQKAGVLKSFDFKSDDNGKRPSLGHIKIWGCEVFVRREAQDKLEARSEKCLFVGYPEESFGYLFYKPKDNVVFVARRGVFIEREMISKVDTGSKIDLEEIHKSADKEPIMHVKTAFLNGKLIKDVFMAQPEGFENAKSKDESCIYVKVSGSVIVFMVLYADDILVIGNDIPTLQSVKECLGKCFAMKDLGDATYIFGINIYRDRLKRLIGLSQDTYLDKILKIFKIENSKEGNLPLHHGIKISKDPCLKTNKELDKMSQVSYASAIVSIMYAMTCTRPHVSFALSMQNTVADSTCESEYIAACKASKEAIWMKNFIGDIGVLPTVQVLIEIFCDNESAVALTKEPKDHEKSKHTKRTYHFVLSKVEEGHMIVKDIRLEDYIVYPFTKAFAKSRHDEHAKSIGLKDKIKVLVVSLNLKHYKLKSLNMVFDAELSINITLSGLPADYNQFVLSYQINGKENSIMELHSLLKNAEQVIKKIDVPSTSATLVLTVGHNAKKIYTSHSNWKGKAIGGKSNRGSKRKAEYDIAPTSDLKE